MGILISEITDKLADVQKMIKQNLLEKLDDKNDVICLSLDEANKMKYFTNLPITEIGKDDRYSGGIYIKNGGSFRSFDTLDIQKQYNIIAILDEILA